MSPEEDKNSIKWAERILDKVKIKLGSIHNLQNLRESKSL